MKISKKSLTGVLVILLGLGWISKKTYCNLCDPADPKCSSVCTPEPTPTVEPSPSPTIEPTPTPTSTPNPTPTPTSIKSTCGFDINDQSSVFIKAKAYGQGIDTELNILNTPEACNFIHSNPVNPNQCHLEGLDSKGFSRVSCEMALIDHFSEGKGKCPVAMWKTTVYPLYSPCNQIDPYDQGGMSCDHFGNTADRDDPNTAPFEGEPKECGNQRDVKGHPKAGFFFIAHGAGSIIACLPNYQSCSRNPVPVVH